MQSLSQQQRLTQKLSPQQIQLMKLIEVPTLHLEERILEELNDNPALELKENSEDDWTNSETESFEQSNADDQSNDTNDSEEASSSDDFELDIDSLLPADDDMPAYATRGDYNPDDDDAPVFQPSSQTSFYEYLMNQVNVLNLNDTDHVLAEFVIGSIDENGYLTRDVQVKSTSGGQSVAGWT